MSRSLPKKFFLLFVMLAPLLLTGCPPLNSGGETGVTEECVGRAKETPWGIKRGDCSGNCQAGKKCDWQTSPDGTREWCGCNQTEPDNCHLFIERPKEGPQKTDCTGDCADKTKQKCVKKEVKKGDVTDVSCECVDKDKASKE